MGLNVSAICAAAARQPILVHGAENFVGRKVLAALEASGWAAPLPFDTRDGAAARRALLNVCAFVRCIAGTPTTILRDAAEFYEALTSAPAKPRMVHVSSMTVYGSAAGEVREDSSLLADLGPYSHAQRDAERIARRYENTVVLRPGGEYGPDCVHWSLDIARLLSTGRLGDLGAEGGGRCNLLFIDDLVEAIMRALRAPDIGGQIFNLGTAQPPTWNEYFAEFSAALRAGPVRRINARRLRIEARVLAPALKGTALALKAARLSGRSMPLPITPAMLGLWKRPIRLDVRRAEEILGLRWTDRSRGLERAAAWCRESLGLHS